MPYNIAELQPLEVFPEGGLPTIRTRQQRRKSFYSQTRTCYQTPLRVFRLIFLLILLPALFVLVPLYMRYRVYSSQMYPMGMTDMRLIDGKISPMWCQRQVVRSNATFNAFVVSGPPELAEELVPVTMSRELSLQDDMKEYWGFYLLQGSTVSVSACVRWPGASLVMIKGYKHLKDCAYIGDDSSEEIEELLEARDLGLLDNTTLLEKLQKLKQETEGKTNHPGIMKRQRAGVSFKDPSQSVNVTPSEVPSENTDPDPKELREILEYIHSIKQAKKDEQAKNYHLPPHLIALPALHRHRDTNVDRGERKFLTFTDLDKGSTENKSIALQTDVTNATSASEIDGKIQKKERDKDTVIDDKTSRLIENSTERKKTDENHDVVSKIGDSKTTLNEDDKKLPTDAAEITKLQANVKNNKEAPKIDVKEATKEPKEVEAANKTSDQQNDENSSKIEKDLRNVVKDEMNEIETKIESTEVNSKEVFEEVLDRLQGLGDKGRRVLKRLHQAMGGDGGQASTLDKTHILSKVTGKDEDLDKLKTVIDEAIAEEKTRATRNVKRNQANLAARAKRQLMIGQKESEDFTKALNEDDEARDFAAEEDTQSDGFAEHHTKVNETTNFDMSNSELWSSFSSSEEALLECEGLILNLPLTPHSKCEAGYSEEDRLKAAQRNAVTYRVPANGYYFFIFNSENEVQTNYISVRFDLQKTRYDIARTALRECRNSTDRCDMLLDIFSSQKVVLEMPLRDNQSLWSEQFMVISECEPRTSVYLFCVISVPILILLFAFQ